VIVLTLILLGSGVGLLAVDPARPGLLLAAHKASFVLWFGVMSIHVLAHVGESLRLAAPDWIRSGLRGRPRAVRRWLVSLVIILGIGLAAAVTPTATAWTHGWAHDARGAHE
jgi:hypothetical protein